MTYESPTIKFAVVDATADGVNTLIAAVAGAKIRVIAFGLTVTAAGEIVLQDITANTARAKFSLAANGGVSYAGGVTAPAFDTAVGEGLEVVNPVGVDTKGFIAYQEVG